MLLYPCYCCCSYFHYCCLMRHPCGSQTQTHTDRYTDTHTQTHRVAHTPRAASNTHIQYTVAIIYQLHVETSALEYRSHLGAGVILEQGSRVFPKMLLLLSSKCRSEQVLVNVVSGNRPILISFYFTSLDQCPKKGRLTGKLGEVNTAV